MIEVVVVGIAAFLTAILSAIAGLGGGVILLLVIAQFVAPTVAIPIQGAIQLVANGSRAVLLRRNVSWPVVGWGAVLLLPASLVGVKLATSLPENAIRIALGVFVLVLAWRPQLLKFRGAQRMGGGAQTEATRETRRMLLGVGAMSGFLHTTVGASGPMVAPFYKAVTATHIAFVATGATGQVFAHISKLIAFSAGEWSIGDHVAMIGIGIVGVIAGSYLGTRLLHRTSEVALDRVFKVVLTVLAIRLLLRAVF